ncbi:MAG: DegV family protein [Butyrivibrio sp.]|jgi:DegV family protein with EDD domain|uniref:DegV family protein n=1 Tax=Butyrivibrio sp. TaxID=28121 RepID=UPI0025C20462|nr:DegV family protein [Butyrivibrio sp.]MBQ6588770.1 DegV family protein [Butyrivibrio sp.]
MAVRIITDSASDIPQEKGKEWGITILPLKVRFGEEEYLDGVTLSATDFYKKLVETDAVPKTSQITPYEYSEEFRKADECGDELIYISISSGVSGSYQSACMAAQEYSDNIYIVDSKQFCISQYIIVQRAVQLRDQGYSAKEIVDIMEPEIKKAHVIAVFDTLEYLKLGGRISAAAAFAGNLLMIKPVITIDEGVVKVIGKARGSKNGHNMLMEFIRKSGGIDYSKPTCLAYSGLSDEMLKKYVEDSKVLYEGHEDGIQYAVAGATIGTYTGPGAIAFAYFEN